MAALASVGLHVEHLPELVNAFDIEDPEHIAVLLEWLPRVDYGPVKDTIARAVTVRAARPVAGPVLLEELWRTEDDNARYAIANALSFTGDKTLLAEIERALRDESLGTARHALVGYFGRWRGDASIRVLRSLLADDDLGRYALLPLAKLRATEARAEIERFLEHEQDWVRADARKALARLAKLPR